jgi:hypothetical protein
MNISRYSIMPAACLALVLSSSAFAQTGPLGGTGPSPTGPTGSGGTGGTEPTPPSLGCDSVHPYLTILDPPYGPRCTGPYDSNQVCANNPSDGGNFNWIKALPGYNTGFAGTGNYIVYYLSGSSALSSGAISSNNLHCLDQWYTGLVPPPTSGG